MSFTTIKFFLTKLPASDQAPLEIKIAKQTIFKYQKDIGDKPLVLEAQVPQPKYATKLSIFLTVIVKELDIDHIQELDISGNGDHIEISVKPKIGLSFCQRFDDRFGFGGKEIVINDQTDKFDYSSTALDPNLTNYIKKKPEKTEDKEEKFTTKYAFFHLLNLPASFKEPLTLHVDKKLAYTMTKSQPLNTEQILKVDLPEEKNEIAVRLQIRAEGYDVNQKFNLKKNGNHIQFAIADEQLRVAQRTDRNFQKIPFQFTKKTQKPQEDDESSGQNVPTVGGSSKGGNVSTVNFYLCNIDATSVKKFVMRLNGNIIHKIEQSIPKNQVLQVKGDFERPNRGDHIVKLSFAIPAKGFFEPYEDEFNLDKHGKFIKLEVVDEYDRQGNVSQSQISVEQDHKPFKFENSSVDTNENSWKGGNEKKDEKKPEPKKEEKKPEPKKEEKPVESKKEEKGGSELDELETLAELYAAGVLTKEEFDYKKKKILGL